MNAETYQRLILEPDVLDHTTLNITLKEVVAKQEFELAAALQRILNDNKIEKPAQTTTLYDARPSYYKIDLPDEKIDQIIDMLYDLEASFTDENGETTPTSAFYAILADKWSSLSKPY